MSWLLDGLAVFFILFHGMAGFKRGFIEELGRLVGFIIAILISFSNSATLFKKMNEIIHMDEWVGLFLSFSLLFSATLIATRVLTGLIQMAFLSKSNRLVNLSLGFIFGGMKGTFILMVFVWLLAILPLQKWSTVINSNSILAQKSNDYRARLVEFFNWEDPVAMSEAYLKQLTQP